MKQYPMDGPPRHIQQMMLSPVRFMKELKEWVKGNKSMRSETIEIIEGAHRRAKGKRIRFSK